MIIGKPPGELQVAVARVLDGVVHRSEGEDGAPGAGSELHRRVLRAVRHWVCPDKTGVVAFAVGQQLRPALQRHRIVGPGHRISGVHPDRNNDRLIRAGVPVQRYGHVHRVVAAAFFHPSAANGQIDRGGVVVLDGHGLGSAHHDVVGGFLDADNQRAVVLVHAVVQSRERQRGRGVVGRNGDGVILEDEGIGKDLSLLLQVDGDGQRALGRWRRIDRDLQVVAFRDRLVGDVHGDGGFRGHLKHLGDTQNAVGPGIHPRALLDDVVGAPTAEGGIVVSQGVTFRPYAAGLAAGLPLSAGPVFPGHAVRIAGLYPYVAVVSLAVFPLAFPQLFVILGDAIAAQPVDGGSAGTSGGGVLVGVGGGRARQRLVALGVGLDVGLAACRLVLHEGVVVGDVRAGSVAPGIGQEDEPELVAVAQPAGSQAPVCGDQVDVYDLHGCLGDRTELGAGAVPGHLLRYGGQLHREAFWAFNHAVSSAADRYVPDVGIGINGYHSGSAVGREVGCGGGGARRERQRDVAAVGIVQPLASPNLDGPAPAFQHVVEVMGQFIDRRLLDDDMAVPTRPCIDRGVVRDEHRELLAVVIVGVGGDWNLYHRSGISGGNGPVELLVVKQIDFFFRGSRAEVVPTGAAIGRLRQNAKVGVLSPGSGQFHLDLRVCALHRFEAGLGQGNCCFGDPAVVVGDVHGGGAGVADHVPVAGPNRGSHLAVVLSHTVVRGLYHAVRVAGGTGAEPPPAEGTAGVEGAGHVVARVHVHVATLAGGQVDGGIEREAGLLSFGNVRAAGDGHHRRRPVVVLDGKFADARVRRDRHVGRSGVGSAQLKPDRFVGFLERVAIH